MGNVPIVHQNGQALRQWHLSGTPKFASLGETRGLIFMTSTLARLPGPRKAWHRSSERGSQITLIPDVKKVDHRFPGPVAIIVAPHASQ